MFERFPSFCSLGRGTLAVDKEYFLGIGFMSWIYKEYYKVQFHSELNTDIIQIL